MRGRNTPNFHTLFVGLSLNTGNDGFENTPHVNTRAWLGLMGFILAWQRRDG
jgi:hypothetical protein